MAAFKFAKAAVLSAPQTHQADIPPLYQVKETLNNLIFQSYYGPNFGSLTRREALITQSNDIQQLL